MIRDKLHRAAECARIKRRNEEARLSGNGPMLFGGCGSIALLFVVLTVLQVEAAGRGNLDLGRDLLRDFHLLGVGLSDVSSGYPA